LKQQQPPEVVETFAYFDVIFFDVFSPDAQPKLWTENVFRKIYRVSRENAVLTTFSSKGDARRAMLAAGFCVEKIPGPSGKREILRAFVKQGNMEEIRE
jgi:tRNA U34 5-methylaminomethyl-2-thiouridine-forming methyltransferase MnmC